ncbi:hypothetical protein [Polymorphospora lycopeni]|uniref:Uncharacterized protein n=1 Tax=Polymorphospora lycopeni TaxID=3140240 RepID=A0ABV5CNN4_9ACTN
MRHHDQQLREPDVVRSHPVPVPEQDDAPDRTSARRADGFASDPRDTPEYDHTPDPGHDHPGRAAPDAMDLRRDRPDPAGDHGVDGHDPAVNGFHADRTASKADTDTTDGPADTVAVDHRPGDNRTDTGAVDHRFDDDRTDATTGDRRPDPVAVDPAADGAAEAEPAGGSGLMPGDVPGEPVAVLIPAATAQALRQRWREVQLRFVDDPRAAAGEAQDLVDEAVQTLATALAEQKDDLGGWRSSGADDTERLRVTVRRYRDFLDRLLDT